MAKIHKNQRVTQNQKEANNHEYYRQHLDDLDSQAFSRGSYVNGISEFHNMQVNYDLLANQINISDFDYVCKPFGENVGEMPADMSNKDIITGKFKKVIGMEAKRPFGWTCLAVNEDATTRKEQAEFGLLQDFVMSNIMTPLQQQAEIKYQQSINPNMSEDEKQAILKQIQEETAALTPPEVKNYMKREHQDPAEALGNQLLNYLRQKEKIKDKFLKGFKHAMASAREVYLVRIINGEPTLHVINSLYFDYGKTIDNDLIEDSDWGVTELHLTPSQVITQFRKELTDKEVDDIYELFGDTGTANRMEKAWVNDEKVFNFTENQTEDNSIRVLYAAWKSERKVGFLTFYDDNEEPDIMLVSENYKFNEAMGDISIEYEWIPEVHHGYKICLGAEPIYIGMGAVPGQHRDLDTLHECKLPFIGVDYDDLNSNATSLVDRMKVYQYYYNIIMYRIEALMASDKGKILAMNLNAIPTSANINLEKFQYYLEANKLLYFNPNEEKNKRGQHDVNMIAKSIDLSLASDINQYIQIAEYIERRCGESVGIPKAAEGQVSANESVRNVQQSLTQSSDILEPYFQLHNSVKQNVLQALVDLAKVAYSTGKPRKLTYALDDMSNAMLDLNATNLALLANSTLGIFVTDSTMASQAKQVVEQLAHAAMQTSQIDLLDVVKVIRAESIQEAEEKLEVGTAKKAETLGQQQQQAQVAQQQQAEAERAAKFEIMEKEHQFRMDEIEAKGKIDLQKQVILSLGFNEDKDMDADGTPDILEIYKAGLDAEIQRREQGRKERADIAKFNIDQQKVDNDKESNRIAEKKANNEVRKKVVTA